ncbi:transcription factor Adf-1-like [Megalops cyprinoides]|uniref:transcription factor Adf-1-like n=1 Tax=Megalops cyprinoides TaxID=118141 RepID=UPI0018648E0E|nr:transcription factor Adf-1-like [Megalops cyprinoides]
MEEQLITAVSNNPELYNCTHQAYKDKNRKRGAWVRISEIIGIPPDDCRKKWKNLRDTYRREMAKEQERGRSGAAATTQRPWRYSAIMGFLNPFLESRPNSGNMESVGNPMIVQEDSDTVGPAARQECKEEPQHHALSCSSNSTSPAAWHSTPTPTPTPAPTPALPSTLTPRFSSRTAVSTPTRPPLKRFREDSFERHLLETFERAANRTEDSDELFLRSLLPMLRPLKTRRKEELKMAMHRLVFDAYCRQEEEEAELLNTH